MRPFGSAQGRLTESAPCSRDDVASPLHAHPLPEFDDDFDELRLVGHYGVDVLVGARNLVKHAAVLPALDAFRLLLKVLHRDLPLGHYSAHRAGCAVIGTL